MNSETVKLTGRDLLWYAASPSATVPANSSKKSVAWRRHLLVVLALVSLKLVAIASSDGVEVVTYWLNDSRSLLGWP